ncbi:hypothetical protein B0H10DRAFT_1957813 [Mycena sp. CBHHK59/15]|nr:hypothetical protein B0H10DRAFT_1957813 [Mycena sp. CBHHK59/15]
MRPPTYQPPAFWTISVTRGPVEPCREEESYRVVSHHFSSYLAPFSSTPSPLLSPIAPPSNVCSTTTAARPEDQADTAANCSLGGEAKGGSLLQDCLRDLWEKAVSIGFNYGEENLARAREDGFSEGKEARFKEGVELGRETPEASEAAMLHEKALEAERVWGYDVGWKLCCELQKPHALQVSPVPSSPPPLSVAATQTDTVAITPIVVAAAAAAALVPEHSSMRTHLDWAKDAATLPICSVHSAAPPLHLRDFSALLTGSPQPFASLQRRRRRSPRPATSSLQKHSPQGH